jgi:hypothetical protein
MVTKEIITILAVVLLFGACPVYAIWDIYSDTDIYSGFYDLINIYDTPPDNTTVNMYGGGADFITTYDGSTLNIMCGSADIGAADFSIINMLGGDIGYIQAWDNATVIFFDSYDVTALVAEDFANIFIIGGNIGNIHTYQSGMISVYGGFISGCIIAHDFSDINIYGYNLNKTHSGGIYGYGQVSGFLMDDTYICVDLYNPEAYSHINLIPEPASLLLLSLGGLLLRKKK